MVHPILDDTEVLLLDLDGTVLDFQASQRAALRTSVEGLGVDWHDDHLATYTRINVGLWQALERGEIDPPTLRRTRWERVLEALGVDHPDPDQVNTSYLRHFAEGAHLLEGAAEAVATLAQRMRIAVVTNGFRDVQYERLERSGIDRHVEAVLVSDEVGAAKPDPAMFDAAFAAMGNPEHARTLMVGDSLSSDIAGGNAYGVRTVWIRGGDYGNEPGQDVTPTLSVDRLADLLQA